MLGAEFGRADLLALRTRIGLVDPTQRTLDWLTAEEIVLTGVTGTIRPLWNRYGPAERARARALLDLVGCGDLADREIRHCSQGERQRVRIARAMMTQPELLILDEPAVGLDLPAREAMLAALRTLAREDPTLTTILVTHHLEELPDTISDAMLLARGRVVAAGKPAQTLTEALVLRMFRLARSRFPGRWPLGGPRRARLGARNSRVTLALCSSRPTRRLRHPGPLAKNLGQRIGILFFLDANCSDRPGVVPSVLVVVAAE